MFQYLLLCLTLFLTSRSKPLKKTTVDVLDTSHYAHKYLVRYGYMADTQESLESGKLQSMRSAITDFQTFAGINITGQLDDETMKWMTKRRCGVKDSIRVRTKRFALQGSRKVVEHLILDYSICQISGGSQEACCTKSENIPSKVD